MLCRARRATTAHCVAVAHVYAHVYTHVYAHVHTHVYAHVSTHVAVGHVPSMDLG